MTQANRPEAEATPALEKNMEKQGKTMRFELGRTVEFKAKDGEACPLRAKYTRARAGQGRTVALSEDEALQHKLRKLMKTPAGRE